LNFTSWESKKPNKNKRQWQSLLQSSKLGNIDLVYPSPHSRVLCLSNSYKVRSFEEQKLVVGLVVAMRGSL